MAGQVVHDDDVAGLEFGNEELFDIGFERDRVDGPVEDEWRNEAFKTQAGDEGCRFPMAMWDGSSQSFAFGRAPKAARHIGGGPGLVDEDQLFRIEIELAFEPGLATFQNVGALLLGRVCGLFLSEIRRRPKKRQIADTLKRCPLSANAS